MNREELAELFKLFNREYLQTRPPNPAARETAYRGRKRLVTIISGGELGLELRFWKDAETGLPHVYDHGVTEDEVRQVLSRTGKEFPGDDHSRIRLGQTESGRYLQVVYVVYVPDPGGESAFVVTAYDLTAKAKRAYRRRQRRKNK